MKIEKIINRELTVEEIESMKKFRFYTDGVSFACLRERVMVMLHDEPSKDLTHLALWCKTVPCQSYRLPPHNYL
jgi:hypothetical protein